MCTVFGTLEVYCMLIDYMHTAQGTNYRGLLCWLTLQTAYYKYREAPRKVTKVPIVLHDYTHLLLSHFGQATVLEWVLEEMRHPPYSPDLAPSDYHLFPNLKKHFHRQRFSTHKELRYRRVIEGAIRIFLNLFYWHWKTINCDSDSYQLCIDKGYEYIEK